MPRRPKHAEVPQVDDAPPSTHNNPPEPIEEVANLRWTAEEWQRWMDQVMAEASARVAELLEVDARFKANFPLQPPAVPGGKPLGIEKWDDDVQSRAASLREKWRDVIKLVENLHEIEKAPVLTATRVIDNAKNRLIAKIQITDSKGRLIAGADAPMNRIRDRATIYATYVDAERHRAQHEEAERLRAAAEAQAQRAAESTRPDAFDKAAEAFGAAEQAEQAAAAPAADRTRVFGAEGGVMSLRGNFRFIEEESDLMALVQAVAAGKEKLEYLAFNSSRIGYAVRSEKVRKIAGCVIMENRSV